MTLYKEKVLSSLTRYKWYLGYLALPRFETYEAAMSALPVTGTEVRYFTIPCEMGTFDYCSTFLREQRGQPEPIQVVSSMLRFQLSEVNDMKRAAALEIGMKELERMDVQTNT